jgi:PleD family two-component response regulator
MSPSAIRACADSHEKVECDCSDAAAVDVQHGRAGQPGNASVSNAILTVDDSASVMQMVKLTLVGVGQKFMQAASSAECLATARSSAIDTVITGLNMLVMDGLTFCQSCFPPPN